MYVKSEDGAEGTSGADSAFLMSGLGGSSSSSRVFGESGVTGVTFSLRLNCWKPERLESDSVDWVMRRFACRSRQDASALAILCGPQGCGIHSKICPGTVIAEVDCADADAAP